MKTNAIIRIILFSLAIVVLGSVLLGSVVVDRYLNRGSSEPITEEFRTEVMGSSFSSAAADVHHMEIEWAAGSITIEPSSLTDQIVITESEVSEQKYAMHVKHSGNTLKIAFCKDEKNLISFGNTNTEAKDLVICVPADWICDSLEIDAAAAEVTVSDLELRNVDFDGASGICRFDNCRIQELDVDTASGDVYFTGTLDSLEFDAMSARFIGTVMNAPKYIDLNAMSGDLELSLPEDCGFTLNLDGVSCDFTSDFTTQSTNGKHIHGDGSCNMNIDAVSGNVCIRKHDSSTHHTEKTDHHNTSSKHDDHH